MGRTGMAIVSMSSILILLSLSNIQASASDTGQKTTRAPGEQLYPEPDVTLLLDSDEYLVDPHYETGGDALITGSIVCIVPDVVPPNIFCEVVVTGFSTEAESTSIVKEYFNRETEEFRFEMEVMVRNDARGGDIIDLDLELKWKYDGTGQGGAYPDHYNTSLVVPPYGKIDLGFLERIEILEIDVGGWEAFRIEVINNGNMRAEMSLEAVDIPDGFEVEIEEGNFILNSYQSRIVDARIRQKEGNGKTEKIMIGVSTDIPDERSYQEFSLDVETRSKPGIGDMDRITLMAVLSFIIFLVLMLIFFIVLRRRGRSD